MGSRLGERWPNIHSGEVTAAGAAVTASAPGHGASHGNQRTFAFARATSERTKRYSCPVPRALKATIHLRRFNNLMVAKVSQLVMRMSVDYGGLARGQAQKLSQAPGRAGAASDPGAAAVGTRGLDK